MRIARLHDAHRHGTTGHFLLQGNGGFPPSMEKMAHFQGYTLKQYLPLSFLKRSFDMTVVFVVFA
jgi:hypothetical protein